MRAKVLASAMILTLGFVALASCAKSADSVTVHSEGHVVSTGWQFSGMQVWEDPDTGCQYLELYEKALTPRMQKRPGMSYDTYQMGCR